MRSRRHDVGRYRYTIQYTFIKTFISTTPRKLCLILQYTFVTSSNESIGKNVKFNISLSTKNDETNENIQMSKVKYRVDGIYDISISNTSLQVFLANDDNKLLFFCIASESKCLEILQSNFNGVYVFGETNEHRKTATTKLLPKRYEIVN